MAILQGDSAIGRSLGYTPTAERVTVRSVQDLLRPQVEIVWEHAVESPVFRIPSGATVFAREPGSGAPLVAGHRFGDGAVLWTAVTPGRRGWERFPFLLQALGSMGLEPPFRSNRLWAFFDSSYRTRADPDYLAARWKLAGIRGLHVAAWHFHEPDPQRDLYLRNLIQSCHRKGILVYAWLELPHVSERFWLDHPEWREQTALLQDAHLDWRKLMNLLNRECFAAASAGVRSLLERFGWDGVNLAELYFESLQGHENPSRFTPMNQEVRKEFLQAAGFDPIALFDRDSPLQIAANPQGLRRFLDYRAGLARRMQQEWLGVVAEAKRGKPDLDVVLTHVDDQFDSGMRDAVGADARAALASLAGHDLTFLIEDPATVWNLGPERYGDIAGKYARLTSRPERLAVDLNIVERYQDVYPTKKQAGAELYQLVNQAALAFPRVALYFEHSIQPDDAVWLSSAAAAARRYARQGGGYIVESPRGVGVRWQGAALVNGKPWPVSDGETVWLPAGRHSLARASSQPGLRLLDLSADFTSASSLPRGLEFTYHSSARAIALFSARPSALYLDGAPVSLVPVEAGEKMAFWLPSGRHTVRAEGPAD
ncbi:MAG: hypothetical protein IT159_10515 [Bryobacterales bacterium]|nr:hypothetical protein [Bryobacterales bacterium]